MNEEILLVERVYETSGEQEVDDALGVVQTNPRDNSSRLRVRDGSKAP